VARPQPLQHHGPWKLASGLWLVKLQPISCSSISAACAYASVHACSRESRLPLRSTARAGFCLCFFRPQPAEPNTTHRWRHRHRVPAGRCNRHEPIVPEVTDLPFTSHIVTSSRRARWMPLFHQNCCYFALRSTLRASWACIMEPLFESPSWLTACCTPLLLSHRQSHSLPSSGESLISATFCQPSHPEPALRSSMVAHGR